MEQRPTKYVIFRTKWGYFGLAGTETTLQRTCLPVPSVDMAKKTLTRRGLTTLLRYDRTYFADLQKEITAYFEGSYVRFDKDISISLAGTSEFGRAVLTALRDVSFGETISYGRLGQQAGRIRAARAVGAVMSKNPLPLLIGCHRVIRADGSLGGFSAPGGTALKRKLLTHEGRTPTP